MHVVVAGWLLGLGPSGANRRLLGLLHAMPPHLQHGERITVLHGPGGIPENPPGEVQWQQVDIPATPTWRRALRQRKLLPELLTRLHADVFDLGFLPLTGRLPCPTCLTIHDTRDLGTFARRSRWLAKRVHARSLKRAAVVIVPSQFTRSELRKELGSKFPIEVVPGGVDSAFLALTPDKHFQKPYFLHVGHLEPRKNLSTLLGAYALFVELQGPHGDVPDLVLVGADAGEGQRLQDEAFHLEIADRVRFKGVVSESQLLNYYAHCTALLFPSRYEGFGLPALEAMAAGKPVFVSDSGALPEVVGDGGFVVQGNRIDAWAEAMNQALEPIDSVMRGHGRLRAEEMVWDRVAAKTLAVWRRVARGETKPVSGVSGRTPS